MHRSDRSGHIPESALLPVDGEHAQCPSTQLSLGQLLPSGWKTRSLNFKFTSHSIHAVVHLCCIGSLEVGPAGLLSPWGQVLTVAGYHCQFGFMLNCVSAVLYPPPLQTLFVQGLPFFAQISV